jgi:hypothetical protein
MYNFTGSWQLYSRPSFEFFEKYLSEISAFQHFPAAANIWIYFIVESWKITYSKWFKKI